MIRLTNLADYAVVLMCELAVSSRRLNAQDLSEKTRIPPPTVAKILNALAKAHVLDSKRGQGGGFAIARPAEQLSVAEIVEAIDGPIALTACADEMVASDCSFDSFCTMRPRWQVISRSVRLALDNVKLADVIGPVSDDGLAALMRGQSPHAEAAE